MENLGVRTQKGQHALKSQSHQEALDVGSPHFGALSIQKPVQLMQAPAQALFHVVGMASGKGAKKSSGAVACQQLFGFLGSYIHRAHKGARAFGFFGA